MKYWPLLIAGSVVAAVPAQGQSGAGAGDSVVGTPATAAKLSLPQDSPLRTDWASDPILTLADRTADAEQFRRILLAALLQNASSREADAGVALAQAQLDEAQAGYLPTVDINASSYRIISRKFSNDPDNIIERSRPDSRTDASASAEYRLWDFGAVRSAVRAAQARLVAAGYDREAAQTKIVTDVISTWYAVFTYQSLVRLSEAFVAAQAEVEAAVQKRIDQGVAPPSDMTRVASLRSEGEIRLARSRRELASAEARFRELTGMEPPPLLLRAPLLAATPESREATVAAAERSAAVLSAEQRAEAAEQDARFARRREMPQVSARVDAGRYGVLEGREDYDVRATLNLRYRLFGGGGKARAAAGAARADAADAVADRVRQEAVRNAAITWADVQALEDQLVALEAAYKAARQSRDVVFARFAALRGSVFDLTEAQSAYLAAAVAYLDGLTQLDAARYTLLARTDRILILFDDPADTLPEPAETM